MSARWNTVWAIVAFLLLVAACGGQGEAAPIVTTAAVSSSTSATTAAGPEATTTTATTEAADTTTTTEPTSDLIEGVFGDNPVEPVAPDGFPEGSAALLVGGPNYFASTLLVTDLESEGLDLSGIEILIWPIGGTGRSMLVITLSEDAAALAEGEGDSEALFLALFDHPLIDELSVTQFAMNVTGMDDEGRFVFTYTASVEETRGALSGEADDDEVEPSIQLKRLES
jgi:hypothetical protein